MNIRVDLNYPIQDGTEVIFRSPVDCSQVTGLKVYYPENGATVSKEFMLADAHGNNVGVIDHLFAENVVVKVIMDVTTGMAFVQNADTNAYIESTFVKSVNGVKPVNGDVAIPTGGGGANTLIVTLSDNHKVASNDAQQIYNHVANGGCVTLEYDESYYRLAYCTDYYAYFSKITDDFVGTILVIDKTALVTQYELFYVSYAIFNKTIGDISSAIDSTVKSVNRVKPDENGNVTIPTGGWTDADKKEIIDEVLAALPNGDEVAY